MTQHTFTSFNPAQRDGSDLEAIMNALHSTHQGSSRPSYAQQGMLWVDKLNNPSRGRLYMFDGSQDIELGTFDFEANTFELADSALEHLGTAAALDVGTAANQIVQLNGDGKLPALDGSLLTNLDLSGVSFPLPDALKVAGIPQNTNGGGGYRSGGVIMADGTLRTWGTGSYGQNGQGSWQMNVREVPSIVTFPVTATSTPIKWVKSGYNNWVLLENGDIYVWGRNNHGELGRGNTVQGVTASRVIAGDIDTRTVVDISVGYASYNNACHVLALTDDGRLYSCGYNAEGQCGTGDTATVTQFTEIGIGQTWAKIYAAGSTYGSSFAITTSGDLYCWGRNVEGNLGLGDGVNRLVPTHNNLFGGVGIAEVSASVGDTTASGTQIGAFSLFLTVDGRVFSCGYNTYGQLGTGNTTWYDTPQEITSLGSDNVQVLAVAGHEGTSYVRKSHASTGGASGATVFSTGRNEDGQLGRNGTTDQNTFAALSGHSTSEITKMIALGGYSGNSALATLHDNGRVYVCGYNDHGNLGITNNTARTGTMRYVYLTGQLSAVDITAVGAGDEASLAILTDTGQYLQTGYGGGGQIGDEDNESWPVLRLIRF